MEKKTISLKELKKRKMLLVLPVLVVPFITMLFWSFGGGKETSEKSITDNKRGFNAILPNPKLKTDIALDKMSYYDQAAMDSIKLQEQIKKDPNYRNNSFTDTTVNFDEDILGLTNSTTRRSALNTTSYKNTNEQKVYQKLEALQKAISQPQVVIATDQDMREFENYGSSDQSASDIQKLEQIMSVMNEPQESDPELKQLGGMLENILDIQHPERVQEKLRQSSKMQKAKTYSVDKKKKQENMSSLQAVEVNKNTKQNSFYSLDQESSTESIQNAIEAVIHEEQKIVNGSVVKLRLVNDVLINGISVPRNTFLFGAASLKGERLDVKITNIQYQNSILPVDLVVYDIDGIPGIYIPGTINRESAKASADRSIQALGIASLDDSWGAQAAGMGVEAAKSLFSKKVKLIKVVVKAGYKVLLCDEKQKNEN